MVDTEVIRFGDKELCKTFSTEGNKLRQVETNTVYGRYCFDIIAGYKDGKPYSRWSYEETDEKDLVAERLKQIREQVLAGFNLLN